MPKNPFSAVLRRVAAAGFKPKFVKGDVLPPWWDDEIAAHPTGLEEGVGLLSVRLGLVPASLRDGVRAEFAADAEPKFKTRQGVEPSDLEPLRHVATYALRLACAAAPPARPFPSSDPAALRRHLLAGGEPCVTLDGLLRLCWSAGVPVLHVGGPVGGKKMDGLAARFGDRYGIALCANHRPPARLLFILAHELGHVLLGHLPDDGVLIDGDGTVAATDTDAEEAEANAFAWTLLTGRADYSFYTHPRWRAADVVKVATLCGERDAVSPGVLAANHGHKYPGVWGAANRALKDLEPDGDGPQAVRDVAAASLDWTALPDEAADYLGRLLGLDETAEAV